jgi:hypothetical protein
MVYEAVDSSTDRSVASSRKNAVAEGIVPLLLWTADGAGEELVT